MKIVSMIARLLLGAVFLFFGTNTFLQFLPMGPLPAGPGGQFVAALMASHYMYPIGVLQVVPGILLLLNRYVPLGLTLLAPVLFNILLVHLLMIPNCDCSGHSVVPGRLSGSHRILRAVSAKSSGLASAHYNKKR